MSPVKVQEMEEHQDNDAGITYQTYEFITGVGFTKEVAAAFSQDELQKIATNLGEFLKQLHSYPLDKAHEISMDSINSSSDYLAFFEERLKTVRKRVFPQLPTEAQQWVEKLWKVYLATSRELFKPKVTHFDMQPVHIIVDQNQHTLSGVIDFSLRIADPARDFMYFNRYGSDFLKAVYATYGEKDHYFDARRQFYAGEFELLEFESILESHNEEKIEKKRRDLLDYIKQFPIL